MVVSKTYLVSVWLAIKRLVLGVAARFSFGYYLILLAAAAVLSSGGIFWTRTWMTGQYYLYLNLISHISFANATDN